MIATVIFETNIKYIFLQFSFRSKKKKKNSNTRSWFCRKGINSQRLIILLLTINPKNQSYRDSKRKIWEIPLKDCNCNLPATEKRKGNDITRVHTMGKKAVKIHETPWKRGKIKVTRAYRGGIHTCRIIRVYIICVTHFAPYSSETLIKNALHASGDFILSFVSPFVYVSQIVHRRQKEEERRVDVEGVGYCEVAIHRGCPFNFACLRD